MTFSKALHKSSFVRAAMHFCAAPLFIIAGLQPAAAATITGTVTDSSTGAPLSGVIVQAVGSFDQIVTDSQGKLSIAGTSTSVHNPHFASATAVCRLTGREISWDAAASMNMKLYTIRGELLDKYSAGAGSHALPPLTSGIFLLESLIDGNKRIDKVRAVGNGLGSVATNPASTRLHAASAKAAAVAAATTITFSASQQNPPNPGDDYEYKQMTIQSLDTSIAVQLCPLSKMGNRRNILIGWYPVGPDDSLLTSLLGGQADWGWPYGYSGPNENTYDFSVAPGWPRVLATCSFPLYWGWGDHKNMDTAWDRLCADSAASGAYNQYYQQWCNIVRPYASTIYAVRINAEWHGDWTMYRFENSDGSICTSSDTWIAGFRNFVTVIRNDPATAHIKIEWDYPFQVYPSTNGGPGSIAEAYYPGDDYVDVIGVDCYSNAQWGPATSEDWWNQVRYGDGGNLSDMYRFATAHGKPEMVPEWGDNYGDGYVIKVWTDWMKTHNFVAMGQWDTDGDCFNPSANKGCNLANWPANQAAFKTAWYNTHYTGSFWTLIPYVH
jgi:hypothetical protein